MPVKYSRSDLVLEAAEVFHWATKRHFQLYLRGVAPYRDSPMEKTLLRLERRKKLRTFRATTTDPKLYALPRKTKNFDFADTLRIIHGLACTECLVRFYLANPNCEVVAESFFRRARYGSVPEGGFLYPEVKDEYGNVIKESSLLLFEFSTRSNVYFHLNMFGKFNAYEKALPVFREDLNAKPGVVFILDIKRDEVIARLKRWKPEGPYWFIDYASFLDIPLGEALTSPIYFRPDGTVSAIRRDAGSLGGEYTASL